MLVNRYSKSLTLFHTSLDSHTAIEIHTTEISDIIFHMHLSIYIINIHNISERLDGLILDINSSQPLIPPHAFSVSLIIIIQNNKE